MNYKFLFAAMTLPMVFTACSQDELLEGVNSGMKAPEVKGYHISINPVLDVDADSRALWDETNAKLTWEKTDLISVYWLGQEEPSANLYGNFNSVFKTTDGHEFTSESMVFEGGNVAVFPGDTKFTKPGELKVKVSAEQNEKTILSTPYISNYLNICTQKNGQSEQFAGYNNGLYSPMKLAANVLYLNLDLSNTENLIKDFDFKIQSVSLVAEDNFFANEAVIKTSTKDVYDKGIVTYKEGYQEKQLETITKSLYAIGTPSFTELKATHITGEDGKYLVKFVVLPTFDGYTALANAAENAKIVIKTNCGTLTLTSAEKEGKEYKNVASFTEAKEGEEAPECVGVVTGQKDKNQTIAELFNQIATSQVIPDEADSKFVGERCGRPYARTIKGDMANATLNNSEVRSSKDILNYVAIHTAMKSKEKMNLILVKTDGDIFTPLTKEALAAVDAKNTYTAEKENIVVTLSPKEGTNTVEIEGGGEIYFAHPKALSQKVQLLISGDEKWTMDDTYKSENVKLIINQATLTINGTVNKDGEQQVLTTNVENRAGYTLNIGGNGTLQIAQKLKNFTNTDVFGNPTSWGIINIAKGQKLLLNESISEKLLEGQINIENGGFLTTGQDVNADIYAKINTSGLIASESTGEFGLTNYGEINIKDDKSTTYVLKNASAGVINLKSRNQDLYAVTNEGKIVYNYNAEVDGNVFKRIASDKFSYVVFGEGNSEISLAKEGNGNLSITEIDMEVRSSHLDFTANNLKVRDFTVANGAYLKLHVGDVLNVRNLYNYGTIELGGTINYTGSYNANGTVYQAGGKIVDIETNVTTQGSTDGL